MRANFNYESGYFIGGGKDISIAERLEQIELSSFYRGEFSGYDNMLLVPAIYDTIRKVRNLSKDSVREYLWNILWPILQKKIEDKRESVSQCTKERWEDRNDPWWDGDKKEDIEKRLAKMTETECLEIFSKEFNYCWKSKYTRDRKQKPERLCYIALKKHNIINYAVLKLMNEKVCTFILLGIYLIILYCFISNRNEAGWWSGGIFAFTYLIPATNEGEDKMFKRYRCTLGASLLCFICGGIRMLFYSDMITGGILFCLGAINLVLVLYTYMYKTATKLGFRIER